MMTTSVLKLFALGLVVALVSCASTPGSVNKADTRALVAIETVRASEAEFAGRVDEIGIVPAFREFVGPNAIMFMPEPVVINPMLADANWLGNVDWRPAYAVAAVDGSIVATAGPSLWTTERGAYPGYYFTVWRRDHDGVYRFVLDGSADMGSDLYTEMSQDLTSITGNIPPVEADWAELEGHFVRAAQFDSASAFRAYLDSDARILRANLPPGLGQGPTTDAMLASEPVSLTYEAQGGGASESGDIVWSYGAVRWVEAGVYKRGTFARVWRYDGTRWTIVLDQRAQIE